MTVVVQTTYRPQIAPAVAGMIASGTLESVKTYLSETVAGIGFGLAVSQGTQDSGVILGGSSFIGVSVRDITLSLAPVDPYSDTENPLDKFGIRTNVAVANKGDIWVLAGANVAAGNALSYNTTTGIFSTGTGGTSATGSLTFTQQPVDGNTIVVADVTVTFKNSGATGAQVNIGPTLGDTIQRTADMITALFGTTFSAAKAKAYPPSPGGAAQGSGANQLLVSAAAAGTGGNALTITAGTTAGVTASAATLLGGTAASTAIANGRWLQTAIAGQLAQISLV